MTAPAGRPSPAPVAEGWRVEIVMPVHVDGRNRGKPVGWLSLNKLDGGTRARIDRWRAAKAWRIAAANALKRRGVPALGRIYLQVELRFPDRIHRDPSNFELVIKPCVDALAPQRSGIRYNAAKKRREPFVDHGAGVVPGDDPRYVVKGPEMAVGEPLGRSNPIKGMVILHITPLPLEGPDTIKRYIDTQWERPWRKGAAAE